MTHLHRRPAPLALALSVGVGVALAVAASAPAEAAGSTYVQHNLVSDVPGLADVTDSHLVNAWGASYLGTSPLWVSDNGADVTTLYSGAVPGGIVPLVVTIPGGVPTGQVSNATTSFVVHDAAGHSGAARFLFVGESGHLSGWNPAVGASAPGTSTNAVDAIRPTADVFKGLAMGQTPDGPQLYVANFSAGTVDVYDGAFQPVDTSGGFRDTRLPAGYAPFNVMVSGGQVYVAYARQDAERHDEVAGQGSGRVDVFDLDGTLVQRLDGHGLLNAPWGMAIAPAGFGSLAGDLLVGNFGDGRINAFDPTRLTFIGTLRQPNGSPVAIDGLWALLPSNGTEGAIGDVVFTAGPQDESHGLVGTLTASS